MKKINNILAVIVLYKTHYQNSVTFQSMAKAMEGLEAKLDIIVYDNSPEHLGCAESFEFGELKIHYKHDPTNSGVSAAYNYGARFAGNMPAKQWLLLLDQDTSFESAILKKYADAIEQFPEIKLFAPILKLSGGQIFSPCKFVFKRGFRLEEISPGRCSLQHISPVNSGMLINLDAFFKAGGYNERVKLDFSDFQFIERFKKTNPVFYVIDSTGFQDFSNAETDTEKLNLRYAFFCDGAKHFEKIIFTDHIQLFGVAFMRAVTLALRTRRLIFFKTFYNTYIKG
jgi:rhamnosyltransferase